MTDYAMFEVGKVYVDAFDDNTVITIKKRFKTIIHFTIKRQTRSGKILCDEGKARFSVKRVTNRSLNCHFPDGVTELIKIPGMFGGGFFDCGTFTANFSRDERIRQQIEVVRCAFAHLCPAVSEEHIAEIIEKEKSEWNWSY